MFPTPVANMQFQIIFFFHLISYLSRGFLQTPKEILNLDSSLKMTWFHWSTNQFRWSLAHTERFRFCYNISGAIEIVILLLYQSWWNPTNAVDRQTVTPVLYQTLAISPRLINWLKTRLKNKLTFISSSCLVFRIPIEPFWTSLTGCLGFIAHQTL